MESYYIIFAAGDNHPNVKIISDKPWCQEYQLQLEAYIKEVESTWSKS